MANATTWKPGQSGNPKGRPPRSVELQYSRIVMRLCDEKAWARIVEKAIADAIAGDWRAREFLARFLTPNAGIDSAAANLREEFNKPLENMSDRALELLAEAIEREEAEEAAKQAGQEVESKAETATPQASAERESLF